jgi:hypothetical protein
MTDDALHRQELLERIKAKRDRINAYRHALKPRGDLQTNLSIVCSALAAAFTAGPALGGTSFTAGVQQALALPAESLVWRVLCLLAMITSLVAAISTNLYKSNDVAGRLSRAETGNAQLEALEATVEFGQIPIGDALKLYQEYITAIPFVE